MLCTTAFVIRNTPHWERLAKIAAEKRRDERCKAMMNTVDNIAMAYGSPVRAVTVIYYFAGVAVYLSNNTMAHMDESEFESERISNKATRIDIISSVIKNTRLLEFKG